MASKKVYAIKTPDGNPVRCEEAWKDSDGNLLNKKVTTDTAQTISGAKTFSSQVIASGGVKTDKVTSTNGTEVLSYDGTTTAFKGKADRPTYNGGDLALKSDVDNVSDLFIMMESGSWANRLNETTIDQFIGHNVTFYDAGVVTDMKLALTKLNMTDATAFNSFTFIGGKNCTSFFYSFVQIHCKGKITAHIDATSTTDLRGVFNELGHVGSYDLFIANIQPGTDCSYMFSDTYSLKVIPAIDLSNASDLTGMFHHCAEAVSILCTGMKLSFDLSDCTKLDQAALRVVIDNLADVTELGTSPTLTLGSTLLAKLTADDITTANNKGWNLA